MDQREPGEWAQGRRRQRSDCGHGEGAAPEAIPVPAARSQVGPESGIPSQRSRLDHRICSESAHCRGVVQNIAPGPFWISVNLHRAVHPHPSHWWEETGGENNENENSLMKKIWHYFIFIFMDHMEPYWGGSHRLRFRGAGFDRREYWCKLATLSPHANLYGAVLNFTTHSQKKRPTWVHGPRKIRQGGSKSAVLAIRVGRLFVF